MHPSDDRSRLPPLDRASVQSHVGSPFDITLPRVTKAEEYPAWKEEEYWSHYHSIPGSEFDIKVDLVAFEEQLRGPIFSKPRLRKIRRVIEKVMRDQTQTIKAFDIEGQEGIVWRGISPYTYDEGIFVFPQYQSYVQLSPKFPDRTPTAFYIDYWLEMPPPDPPTPEYWDQVVQRSKQLWDFSLSKRLLQEKFRKAAKSMIQVKKIVCFGNGTMCGLHFDENGNPDGIAPPNDSLLQHLSAFTIAETLNEEYASKFTKPIQVVFQDPAYEDVDRRIWPQFYMYDHVKFVNDPQGFLEVDEHTLVISAFLPLDVPLLQICADSVPKGPAGFIHTTLNPDINAQTREFSVRDIVSPKVVKLLSGYERSNFHDHDVEQELFDELCEGVYWLWRMDCFLKLRPGPSEVRRRKRTPGF